MNISENNLIISPETVEGTCPATGFQKANICVPVTVTPFAHAGATITKCCGEPVVSSAATKTCNGEINGTCNFTIRQTICVEVPVEFGAVSKVGDTFVECLEASAKNICGDCHWEGADET